MIVLEMFLFSYAGNFGIQNTPKSWVNASDQINQRACTAQVWNAHKALFPSELVKESFILFCHFSLSCIFLFCFHLYANFTKELPVIMT